MPALTRDRVDDYLRLAFGPVTEAQRARVVARLADGDWAARRPFACDAAGELVAVAWLLRDPSAWTLVAPRSPGPLDEAAVTVIDEAIAVARDQGAGRVEMRVPEARCTVPLLRAVARSGGIEGPGRVEFEAALVDLPLARPDGSRPDALRFEPATDEAHAAEGLARCAVASPDALREPADVALRRMLVHPRRRSVLGDVVHLGYLGQDADPVAFVCAQIDPRDGWCTIPIVGLAPVARSRGLGAPLHRHGLAMLRAQGGVVYRGGTSLDNLPMRACFARNGVPEVERYREFAWRGLR